jgi:M6 family metalloprotease-like protein
MTHAPPQTRFVLFVAALLAVVTAAPLSTYAKDDKKYLLPEKLKPLKLTQQRGPGPVSGAVDLGMPSGGWDQDGGVYLPFLHPKGTLYQGGLRGGDIITAVDGKLVGFYTLAWTIAGRTPGDTVTISFTRDGVAKTERVKLLARSSYQKEFKLAVVPFEFTDSKHRLKPEKLDEMYFSTDKHKGKWKIEVDGVPAEMEVFGSVANYFAENSLGKFTLKGKIFDWVDCGKTRAEAERLPAGPDPNDPTGANPAADLVEAIVAKAGRAASDESGAKKPIDIWAEYDAVAVIHAGEPTRNFQSFLWPAKRFSATRVYYVMNEGGPQGYPYINIHVHEVAHMFGLADQYDIEPIVGPWCAMANGYLSWTGEPRLGRPFHLCPWCKKFLGWINPPTIDPGKPAKIKLRPFQRTGDAVILPINDCGTRYLLLANMQRIGFDTALGGTGLMIWEVDEAQFPQPTLNIHEAHGGTGPSASAENLDQIPWPTATKKDFTFTAAGEAFGKIALGNIRRERVRDTKDKEQKEEEEWIFFDVLDPAKVK